MILFVAITAAALVVGFVLPLRAGVLGFVGAAAALFLMQAGIHTARGFEGTSIDESLLLFNGSWAAYIGFNLQITFRGFALPLFALAIPFIYRLGRT